MVSVGIVVANCASLTSESTVSSAKAAGTGGSMPMVEGVEGGSMRATAGGVSDGSTSGVVSSIALLITGVTMTPGLAGWTTDGSASSLGLGVAYRAMFSGIRMVHAILAKIISSSAL